MKGNIENTSDLELESMPNLFDKNKLLDWLNQTKKEDVRAVRLKLLQNIKYVPYSQFYKSLRDVASEKLPKRYVVAVDYKVGKSKYWVFSLVQSLIKESPDFLLYTAASDSIRNSNLIEKNGITNFVIFDDCAYSGSQMNTTILQLYLCCLKTKSKEMNVDIRVPFLTTNALQLLKSSNQFVLDNGANVKINLPKKPQIIPTIGEILTPQEVEILRVVHPALGKDIYLGSTLTYFEHKAPDGQSFAIDIKDCMKTNMFSPYKQVDYLEVESEKYSQMR